MWSTLPPPFTLTGDDLSGGSSGHRRGSNRGDSAAQRCAIIRLSRGERTCASGHKWAVFTVVCLTTTGSKPFPATAVLPPACGKRLGNWGIMPAALVGTGGHKWIGIHSNGIHTY